MRRSEGETQHHILWRQYRQLRKAAARVKLSIPRAGDMAATLHYGDSLFVLEDMDMDSAWHGMAYQAQMHAFTAEEYFAESELQSRRVNTQIFLWCASMDPGCCIEACESK